MKKIFIDQTRNGLSQYDSSGFGYLSEAVLYQFYYFISVMLQLFL